MEVKYLEILLVDVTLMSRFSTCSKARNFVYSIQHPDSVKLFYDFQDVVQRGNRH